MNLKQLFQSVIGALLFLVFHAEMNLLEIMKTKCAPYSRSTSYSGRQVQIK